MDFTTTIIDPDDPRVAEYRHMNDQAARRKMEGDTYFLSEGWLSIDHLIATQHQFRSVLLSPSRVKRFSQYIERDALANVPIFVAEPEVMRAIVGFDMPRAVVMAMNRHPHSSLANIIASTNRLLVLEALNDNENVGAIARAARAFGFDAMILSPTCTDPYYRRTVRVSMGEILHLRIARPAESDWAAVVDQLHEADFATWAMTPSTDSTSLWAMAVPDRLAVFLGAEGPGLTAGIMDAASHKVRIPISPDVDSLNVGHAAAITLAAISR